MPPVFPPTGKFQPSFHSALCYPYRFGLRESSSPVAVVMGALHCEGIELQPVTKTTARYHCTCERGENIRVRTI